MPELELQRDDGLLRADYLERVGTDVAVGTQPLKKTGNRLTDQLLQPLQSALDELEKAL